MNDRKLMILGIVAGVMVVLAVGQSYLSRIEPAQKGGEGGHLIQGLDPGMIQVIEIGKGDNPVRLERQGGIFVAANKEDYPASTSKVNGLLTSCLDIKTVSLITSNPANHKELDVAEENAQNVIKFLGEGDKLITGIVIGSSRLPELQMANRSTYVRLISSNDVYEAKDVPLPGGTVMDYIEKQIVNIDGDDVVRVTVTGPDGGYTLRAADGNDGDIIMDNMPAGKKLKADDATSLFSALSYFSFSDVKKEAPLEQGGPTFDRTYVCELKDGMMYAFDIARVDDKTYVKCSAAYAGDNGSPAALPAGLGSDKAKLMHERAADFNGNHAGWIYEISDWSAKKLTKKPADLLEEEKKEEKAGGGKGGDSLPAEGASEPAASGQAE
ncbi:MAG TPA: DUF4340 domain-containing protein [Sedimentisphaerales bacterium]|nr:DUF4340 domain-containing protein [Sedimentisphaerales bacterium]